MPSIATSACSSCRLEILEDRRLLAGVFDVANLVGSVPLTGQLEDSSLVDPWGLARNTTGPMMVVKRGIGAASTYNGRGVPDGKGVGVPGTGPTAVTGNPTGAFRMGSGEERGPAKFIFASRDGTISAWNPDVNKNSAVVVVHSGGGDNAPAYTGVAVNRYKGNPLLYAADLKNRRVDVFDSGFGAAGIPGSFTDPRLPSGYAPFNVQAIGSRIYVAFARPDSTGRNATSGSGRGIISVFGVNGIFVKRLATNTGLNAPWGIVRAPSAFGDFSRDLLVSNTGDGTISAFDFATGRFEARIRANTNTSLRINGLKGIEFGNGDSAGGAQELFFTAGPDSGQRGIYGRIKALDRVPEFRRRVTEGGFESAPTTPAIRVGGIGLSTPPMGVTTLFSSGGISVTSTATSASGLFTSGVSPIVGVSAIGSSGFTLVANTGGFGFSLRL